jgi:hypothetical protein
MKPITPRLLMARINKHLQRNGYEGVPAALHKSRPLTYTERFGTYYLVGNSGTVLLARVDLLALARKLNCIQEWEQLC